MWIFDKIKNGKGGKTPELKQITNYEDATQICDTQARVVSEEAKKLAREWGIENCKSPEEMKEVLSKGEIERLYEKFQRFMEGIETETESQSKPDTHQEQPKANDYEDWDLSAMYDIRPPKEPDNQRRKQESERIKKYKVLCQKGYIDESFSRKLSLPYILEKKENGQTLTQSEQEILDDILGKGIPEMGRDYTKAVLMLQTIGLIDNYKTAFPKTNANALITMSIDYGLCKGEEHRELFKALDDECSGLADTNRTNLSYFVEKTLTRLKSISKEDRDPGVQGIVVKGLLSGHGYSELGTAMNQKNVQEPKGEISHG